MPDKTPQTDSAASEDSGRFPKFMFLALFLPIAALVVVVGFSLATLRTEARIKEILDQDGSRLQLVSGFLGAEILGSLQHLRSLTTESITLQAVNSPEPGLLQALEYSFLTLAQRNPQYQQIRWIDKSGREKVRIMRDQDAPFAVAAENLQDISNRYYFKEANVLLPGELYTSRIDLYEKQGQIEVPPRPILRIATPVQGNARKHLGIIIINIDMKYLFNLVNAPMRLAPDAKYFLLNQKGVLLNGVVDDYRDAAGAVQKPGFIQAHPQVWEKLQANDSGSLNLPDGLWSWETLSPVETFYRSNLMLPKHLVAFDQMVSNDFSLTMMMRRPPGILSDVRYENRLLVSLGTVFILSVYGLALFFYLSGQVRARSAEAEAAHAKGRASNMARLMELEERFHRLVEASSIGQLVVDSGGRIDIANPAAERMLGYERGELEGLQVDALLPVRLQKKHVQLREHYMQAPEGRRMGVGRELEAVRKDGSTVPVEVGLNPYSDHGRALILASIIDLSAKKKDEDI